MFEFKLQLGGYDILCGTDSNEDRKAWASAIKLTLSKISRDNQVQERAQVIHQESEPQIQVVEQTEYMILKDSLEEMRDSLEMRTNKLGKMVYDLLQKSTSVDAENKEIKDAQERIKSALCDFIAASKAEAESKDLGKAVDNLKTQLVALLEEKLKDTPAAETGSIREELEVIKSGVMAVAQPVLEISNVVASLREKVQAHHEASAETLNEKLNSVLEVMLTFFYV